jgi:esterase/lipase superfamily enzyme
LEFALTVSKTLAPIVRLATALLLGLTLAACGGNRSGNLVAVAETPVGTSLVPILIATTRARPDAPLAMFNGERSRTLNHAEITVSIPPAHVEGAIEWPSSPPGNPATNFVTAKRDYIDRASFTSAVRREIAKRKGGDRDVLVFIHGYNTSFEEAVYRFAQIVKDSDFKGVPVLFTWPSRAELLEYPYDRESTVYSRDDLEATLAELAAAPGLTEVHVLAHSMGNFLTMETLRQAAIRGRGDFGGKLGQVMLAAPDVDIDVFRAQMGAIGKMKHPLTVLISHDDKALNFSRKFAGNVPRLGAYNLAKPENAEQLQQLGIKAIDLTALKAGDSLNHGKFAESPQVVQLIGRRLADDRGISTAGPSLGDSIGAVAGGVVDLVGNTAGVVTSPITILTGR